MVLVFMLVEIINEVKSWKGVFPFPFLMIKVCELVMSHIQHVVIVYVYIYIYIFLYIDTYISIL